MKPLLVRLESHKWTFLTSRGRSGMQIVDGHIIPLRSDLVPGEYSLEIGLFDSVTLQRLPILDASGAPSLDIMIIAPILIRN